MPRLLSYAFDILNANPRLSLFVSERSKICVITVVINTRFNSPRHHWYHLSDFLILSEPGRHRKSSSTECSLRRRGPHAYENCAEKHNKPSICYAGRWLIRGCSWTTNTYLSTSGPKYIGTLCNDHGCLESINVVVSPALSEETLFYAGSLSLGACYA